MSKQSHTFFVTWLTCHCSWSSLRDAPLHSRVRAEGQPLPCSGPSAAVTVQPGCDVLDKGAVWSGLPDTRQHFPGCAALEKKQPLGCSWFLNTVFSRSVLSGITGFSGPPPTLQLLLGCWATLKAVPLSWDQRLG